MKTQTITFEQWRREAPQLRARSEQVLAGFDLAQREKSRVTRARDDGRAEQTP
jgi:hypothetical protein